MVGLDWVENSEDSSCGELCVIVSRGMNSAPFTSSTSMSTATAGTGCRQCVHDLHVCGYVRVHMGVWVCGCAGVWVCVGGVSACTQNAWANQKFMHMKGLDFQEQRET